MSKSSSKQNEFGPDHIEYYRQLLLELLSGKEDLVSNITGASSGGHIKRAQDKTQSNGKEGSFPLFAEGIGGLSEYDKERLKLVLHELVTFLNKEADEIIGQIVETSKFGSEKLLPSHTSRSDQDMVASVRSKKRKAATLSFMDNSEKKHDHPSDNLEQVTRAIQAIQGSGEIHQVAVQKLSSELLAKLGKMAQDVDDLLNKVASKCRPMTTAEKRQLGKEIRTLPEKALDRVVEIVEMRRSSKQNSEKVSVKLQELDNVTLWRLYYFVEVMLKANKT